MNLCYNEPMDKYEKEFSEKIKQAAKEMHVDRLELGELRLKRFVAMLYLLLKERQESFDLLVGGGNSGVATIEVAKMVYKKTNKELPPIALFPVIRPSNQDGVQIDKSLVASQLKDIDHVSRLLFVDDEIMRAQTAKVCFETIRDYLGPSKVSPCLSSTIVAENHNFVWRYDLQGISVRFLPFALVLQGYNGNFGYLIPDETISQIEPIIGSPIDRNKALAVLLGNKCKEIENGISTFDEHIESELISKVDQYKDLKEAFHKRIEELVDEGIKEYTTGDIQFRYLP